MKKHANIPIFIPHLGCPNQCVFCNQRTISGHESFDISSVRVEIEKALSTIDNNTHIEIAFFGGSFTGIDRGLMTELLQLAYSYIKLGRVESIRCSTRPDYIDTEVLDILKKYGVRTIELGLQSTSELVLGLSKRGHSFKEEEQAVRLITEHGFELVGQMMIGLPGSTLEAELATADFIIRSGARASRIYPTVVFYDTELCDMAISGIYTPISDEDAIYRSACVLQRFVEADIEVIRIGLCAQDNLYDDGKYYGGPNHSALGELVIGELYYNRVKELIRVDKKKIKNKTLHIFVSPGSVSKAIGQKKRNTNRLLDEFNFEKIIVTESSDLSGYELKIDY